MWQTGGMSKLYLAASGDLRQSANRVCWPAQAALEESLNQVLAAKGFQAERIHAFDPEKGHGFLDSQRAGLEAFRGIDSRRPLIVAEAVWQYSHHILPGLLRHKAPILTVANWSGQWPGLVGMLNLNGCLTKCGRPYATLWSEDFKDDYFLRRLDEWLTTGKVSHSRSHVRSYRPGELPAEEKGRAAVAELTRRGIILGVFDEGCMGMHNAIIPDERLFPMGVCKERLSQSALLYGMSQVTDQEARECFDWIVDRGMTFHFGPDPKEHLTEDQVLQQCRMYIAAARIADEFGCDALGIQYQQGLKDMAPASDLVEGLLNNSERPPVRRADGSVIRDGEPYTHFNEVDECAGLDGVLTQAVHKALGQPVENTLHDLRWGDPYGDQYVWVFEISGAAPPAHHVGGFSGSQGHRQPPMYFPSGGSTLAGVAKPGEIVWSRIYVEPDGLCMDIGRGQAIELPEEETRRRLDATTPVWPIMHAVLKGVTRDQMMAKHQANHLQVAYGHDAAGADACLLGKAAAAASMGIKVNLCGV